MGSPVAICSSFLEIVLGLFANYVGVTAVVSSLSGKSAVFVSILTLIGQYASYFGCGSSVANPAIKSLVTSDFPLLWIGDYGILNISPKYCNDTGWDSLFSSLAQRFSRSFIIWGYERI